MLLCQIRLILIILILIVMREQIRFLKYMGFTSTDTKSRHLEFSLITDFDCWEINILEALGMPLCQI